MAKDTPTVLLEGLAFPEGPRWHDDRLWFSDMQAREVVSVNMAGERRTVLSMNDSPSGLGWFPDGRLLVVSMGERKLLGLHSTDLTLVADLSELTPYPCNDMVVSRKGHAYIGNFGFLLGQERSKGTHLIMVTSSGEARTVAEDLMFPNGMVITEDEKTLIVAETFGRRLTAFDLEPDGGLSNRRVWAELDVPPDGICLDAEGCIWVAVPVPPGGFVRVAEGGEIKRRLDTGDRCGYACMLGGPEQRTLFMLEALTHTQAKSGNGRIRILEVDAPRAGCP